ncbi:N-acetyltransferase [Mahella australiensis]|uniref:Transferase hexapeptide repeat containing protein n=1 Tax=Mahella australiensis (strain DSM 15567 / CIP 107919 / 50-1 BON) TaxID=697281 RepID=F3ZXR3_MAHA5|nr:N-acetyltransferase [Mahella australiensis]AEE95570.1 hypothetical protein Mahau_0354 [Mahella australiensis 50-1 BON]
MERHISSSAHMGENVSIGYNAVIAENVIIGDDCTIGHNVVIYDGSRIGRGVRIDDNAVIGKQPMRAANSIFKTGDVLPPASIGDYCIVGTSAVVYAGANIGEGVLIADLATVRENVSIDEHAIIGRGVAVENYCTIGAYCKIETNAYITAYSNIEDRAFVGPGVVTTNDNFVGRTEERFKHFKGVTVKRGGRIAAHATILPGKVINEDGLVAAGSVVTKDVPAKKIVMGTPARKAGDVPEEQLLEKQK